MFLLVIGIVQWPTKHTGASSRGRGHKSSSSGHYGVLSITTKYFKVQGMSPKES